MKNFFFIISSLLFLACVGFALSLNIVFGLVVTIMSLTGTIVICSGVHNDTKEQEAADRRRRALYGLNKI